MKKQLSKKISLSLFFSVVFLLTGFTAKAANYYFFWSSTVTDAYYQAGTTANLMATNGTNFRHWSSSPWPTFTPVSSAASFASTDNLYFGTLSTPQSPTVAVYTFTTLGSPSFDCGTLDFSAYTSANLAAGKDSIAFSCPGVLKIFSDFKLNSAFKNHGFSSNSGIQLAVPAGGTQNVYTYGKWINIGNTYSTFWVRGDGTCNFNDDFKLEGSSYLKIESNTIGASETHFKEKLYLNNGSNLGGVFNRGRIFLYKDVYLINGTCISTNGASASSFTQNTNDTLYIKTAAGGVQTTIQSVQTNTIYSYPSIYFGSGVIDIRNTIFKDVSYHSVNGGALNRIILTDVNTVFNCNFTNFGNYFISTGFSYNKCIKAGSTASQINYNGPLMFKGNSFGFVAGDSCIFNNLVSFNGTFNATNHPYIYYGTVVGSGSNNFVISPTGTLSLSGGSLLDFGNTTFNAVANTCPANARIHIKGLFLAGDNYCHGNPTKIENAWFSNYTTGIYDWKNVQFKTCYAKNSTAGLGLPQVIAGSNTDMGGCKNFAFALTAGQNTSNGLAPSTSNYSYGTAPYNVIPFSGKGPRTLEFNPAINTKPLALVNSWSKSNNVWYNVADGDGIYNDCPPTFEDSVRITPGAYVMIDSIANQCKTIVWLPGAQKTFDVKKTTSVDSLNYLEVYGSWLAYDSLKNINNTPVIFRAWQTYPQILSSKTHFIGPVIFQASNSSQDNLLEVNLGTWTLADDFHAYMGSVTSWTGTATNPNGPGCLKVSQSTTVIDNALLYNSASDTRLSSYYNSSDASEYSSQVQYGFQGKANFNVMFNAGVLNTNGKTVTVYKATNMLNYKSTAFYFKLILGSSVVNVLGGSHTDCIYNGTTYAESGIKPAWWMNSNQISYSTYTAPRVGTMYNHPRFDVLPGTSHLKFHNIATMINTYYGSGADFNNTNCGPAYTSTASIYASATNTVNASYGKQDYYDVSFLNDQIGTATFAGHTFPNNAGINNTYGSTFNNIKFYTSSASRIPQLFAMASNTINAIYFYSKPDSVGTSGHIRTAEYNTINEIHYHTLSNRLDGNNVVRNYLFFPPSSINTLQDRRSTIIYNTSITSPSVSLKPLATANATVVSKGECSTPNIITKGSFVNAGNVVVGNPNFLAANFKYNTIINNTLTAFHSIDATNGLSGLTTNWDVPVGASRTLVFRGTTAAHGGYWFDKSKWALATFTATPNYSVVAGEYTAINYTVSAVGECVPQCGDVVLFDNLSFPSATDSCWIGTGNAAFAGTMLWNPGVSGVIGGAPTSNLNICQSLYFNSNMVNNMRNDIIFTTPNNNAVIVTKNKPFLGRLLFQSTVPSVGKWSLTNNITTRCLDAKFSIDIQSGTLATNGYTVNTCNVNLNSLLDRGLLLSTSKVNLNFTASPIGQPGACWVVEGNYNNLKLDADSADFTLNGNSRPTYYGFRTWSGNTASQSYTANPGGLGHKYKSITINGSGNVEFRLRKDTIGVINNNINNLVFADAYNTSIDTFINNPSALFTANSNGGSNRTGINRVRFKVFKSYNSNTSYKYGWDTVYVKDYFYLAPGMNYVFAKGGATFFGNKCKVIIAGNIAAGQIDLDAVSVFTIAPRVYPSGTRTPNEHIMRMDSSTACLDSIHIRNVWATGNGGNFTNPTVGVGSYNTGALSPWPSGGSSTIQMVDTVFASSRYSDIIIPPNTPVTGAPGFTASEPLSGRARFLGGPGLDPQTNAFGWEKNDYPPTPILNLASANYSVCPGTVLTLSLSGQSAIPFTLFYIDNGVNVTFSITSSSQLNTYNSSNGAFTFTTAVTPTVNTIYKLGFLINDRCFNPQSATGTGTVNVTIRPIPTGITSNFTPSAVVCNGAVLTLTSTSTAGTNYTLYPTPTGTLDAMPMTSYAAGAATNGSITLNATGTYTAGSSPATYTVYTDVTTAFGCPATSRVPVTFTVNPTPSITNASAQTICTGNTATISAINSFTDNVVNNWSSPTIAGITGHSASGTGDVAETLVNTTNTPKTVAYTYTPTVGSCAGAAQQFTVTVNPAPTMSSPTNTTICSGNTLNFGLTSNISGSTFEWSAIDNSNVTGESTSTQITSTVTDAITNNVTSLQQVIYTVTPTSTLGSCVGASQTVTVNINPTPALTSANTATVCSGTALNLGLTSNVASTYTWVAANNTNVTGESTTNVVSNTINNTLITSAGGSSEAVLYTVTPSSSVGNCLGSAQQVTVTINPTPTVSAIAANSGSICANTSGTIQATGGNTYTWNPSSNINTTTGNEVTFTAPSSTNAVTYTYNIVTTNTTTGCNNLTSPYTVSVTGLGAPIVTSASTNTVCSGVPVNMNLTSSSASTFNWIATDNTNTNGESVIAQSTATLADVITNTTSVIQNVVYTVTPTSTLGSCVGTPKTVTITVNPTPQITSTNTATLCSGNSLNIGLTSNVASTYTWVAASNTNVTGESTSNQTTNTINNTLSTAVGSAAEIVLYTVTPMSSAGNCLGTAQQVSVTVNSSPSVTAVSSSSAICSGNTATLTAAGADTYTWTSGPVSDTYTVATTGTYPVVGTNTLTGCTNTTNVSLLVNPTPTVNVSASSGTICAGQTTTLTAATANSYAWSTSSIANTTTVAPTGTTVYTVTGTNTAGSCTATAQYTVNVNPKPDMALTNTTSVICLGDANGTATVNTTNGTSAYTYSWSGSASTSSVATGLSSGTHTTIVTDARGCKDTLLVSIAAPSASLASSVLTSTTGCSLSNGTATLTATGGWNTSYTYVWQANGSSTNTATGYAAGTYTALITDANGCAKVQNFTISNPSTPTISAVASNPTICSGVSTTITPSGAVSYTISGGAVSSSTVGTSFTVNPTTNTTYSIVGTDASNCISTTATVAINVNVTPTVAIAASSGTICSGQTTTLTAATANNYSWSSGQTVSAISVAPTTNTVYTVIGTNTAGTCTASAQFSVTVNTTPTVAIAASSGTICSGQTTTLTAATADGYNWSSGQTANTIAVAPTTNTVYTVIGTNTAGTCTASAQFSVTVNATPTVAIAASSGTICSGQTTTLTAATANNYSWSSGQSVNTIAVAPTTNTVYTVIGTNTAGTCTASAQYSVTVNALPVVTAATSSAAICSGNTATLTAGGADTYTWTSGPTTSTYTVTSTGNYVVTGTDANGCINTANVSLLVNSLPTVTAVSNTTAICAGNSATLTAGGAITYTWTSPSSTNTVITVNATGNYEVTGTDVNGCVNTQTVALTVNALPTLTASTITNVSCFGANNGSIIFTPAAGTPTYAITGTSVTGTTATGLPPANYTYTVTDAAGCVNTTTVSITEPAAALLSTAAETATNTSCTSPDGVATVTITGGTGPSYTITSSPGTVSGNTITGLGTGVYSYTVTDQNNCKTTNTGTITGATGISSTLTAQSNVLCFGNNTASLSVLGLNEVSGTYNYTLTNTGTGLPVANNSTGIFTNLSAGTYSVHILGGVSNCVSSQNITITQPTAALNLTGITANSVVCNGGTALATATITGGTSPYTYVWASNTNTTTTNTTSSVTYTAGNYSVDITDANGCVLATQNFTIHESPVLSIASVATTTTGCGLANGTATINANGGWSSYTYTITDSGNAVVSNTTTATGLTAGTYTANVVDALGCATQTVFAITNPSTPTLSITSNTAVICAGETTTLNPTGAVSYTLTSPTTTTFVTSTNVSPAVTTVYTIVGTDIANCTSSPLTVTVNVNALPIVSLSSTSSSICAGQSATLTASGADTYVWSSSANTTDTEVVNPSSQTVYTAQGTNTLTGCSSNVSATYTVNVNALPTAAVASQTNITCLGDANGSIVLSSSSTNTTVAEPTTNLAAGNYTFTITDLTTTCSNTVAATIAAPAASLAISSIATQTAACATANGSATITAQDGWGTYTYSVNGTPLTGGVVTGLLAGNHTAQVSDAMGCVRSTTFEITNPNAPTLSITSNTIAICAGETATFTPTGAVNYSLNVTPFSSVTTETVNPTITTVYNITGTDINSCVSSPLTVTVNVNALPTVSLTSTSSAICAGQSVTLTASGADSYVWSSSANTTGTEVVSPSSQTVYTAQGTNTLTGCSSNVAATYTVNVNALPTATIVSQNNILCFGQTNGSVTLATTPSNASISSSTTSLGEGVHTFTITDNGCSSIITATITAPSSALTASVVNTSTNTSCSTPNGAFTVTAIGGMPSYTYSATNTNTTGIFVDQGTGTQNVTVTDANGCTYSVSATIPGANTPSITATTQTNVLCNGGATGSASISVIGGTPTYTYTWSNNTGLNSNEQNNLQVGSYTVTATDAGSCVVTQTFVITEPNALNVLTTNIVGPCIGQTNGAISIEITGGTPNYNIVWNPSSTIENTSNTSTISNIGEGAYVISVTDANGCNFQRSIAFNSINDFSCSFVIPEIFSPNGDGKNDTWEIKGLENYPNNNVTVFNRWGDQVFKAEPYKNDWDGTNTGDKSIIGKGALPVGTYYFILDLGNGDKPITGYVQLTK